jgi:hypothetical protein
VRFCPRTRTPGVRALPSSLERTAPTRNAPTRTPHPTFCSSDRRQGRRAGGRRSTGGKPGAADGSEHARRSCMPRRELDRSVGCSARTPGGRPAPAASGGGRLGRRIDRRLCRLDLPSPAIDAPAGGSGGRARGPRATKACGCEARRDYAGGLLLRASWSGQRRGRPPGTSLVRARLRVDGHGTAIKAGHVIARSPAGACAELVGCWARPPRSPAGPAEIKAGRRGEERERATGTYTTRRGPWAEWVVWWRLPSPSFPQTRYAAGGLGFRPLRMLCRKRQPDAAPLRPPAPSLSCSSSLHHHR